MSGILVPIKRVPDYEARLALSADGSALDFSSLAWIINPFDEIALSCALSLQEAQPEIGMVTAVSVGPLAAEEQLRAALAMGAHEALLVETQQYIDSALAARALAQVFLRGDYQLILMGKQAVDSDSNQTGQLLASSLGIPQGTFASEVTLEADLSHAVVSRETDLGLEKIRLKLPAVITADLRLCEPRYPTLPGILASRRKNIQRLKWEELGVFDSSPVRIVSMELVSKPREGRRLNSVDELSRLVRQILGREGELRR